MKEFCEFAGEIRDYLSKNNYQFTSKRGEYGAYRFNKHDLYSLGYTLAGHAPLDKSHQTVVPKNIFLSNKLLQDNLFREQCRKLREYVMEHFHEKIGSTLNNAPVSLSGLIAAVYLCRYDKVKFEELQAILNSDSIRNKGIKDILTCYFNRFSNYDLIAIK
jgi:hypothetical protein